MNKLNIRDNRVLVPDTCKKKFNSNITIRKESLLKCQNFAYEMTYGKGYHNPESFGNSSELRKKNEIFRDAFQGKVAELAFYNYFYKMEIALDNIPDFNAWGKGTWEDLDFSLNKGKYKISVKSTKHFGNFLLLEKDRYNQNGAYLDSVDRKSLVTYDFTFLVRIKGIDETGINQKYDFSKVKAEITGFITHSEFLNLIKNDQYLRKGVILGFPLKVDNYFEFAQDLNDPKSITNFIS